MAKYRKKPIVIEAMQFDGTRESAQAIMDRWGDVWLETMDGYLQDVWTNRLEVQTLEGHMICSPSDWIIQGVKGELYPCKDDIFQATYEEVEEE